MLMIKMPEFPLYATAADKAGWWALRAACVLVLVFLLAPILVMVPLSFSDSSFLAYPIPGWSLKWYRNLFESTEWARATRNSFIVAPAATLLATSLGTLAAVGLSRATFPFKGLLMGVLIAPMVVPIVVVGVATYLYFAPIGLADTFFHITLPVIAPGVISGALFAFATSFDEVVVTLFLAGAEQATLPRQMFTGIRENISPTIAAVATLLICFTTALLLALEWLRGRKR